jgi:hypothetical protein
VSAGSSSSAAPDHACPLRAVNQVSRLASSADVAVDEFVVRDDG